MSNERTQRRRRERLVIVRGVRREQIDVRKLSRALIALAQAQAETEARAQNEAPDDGTGSQETAP